MEKSLQGRSLQGRPARVVCRFLMEGRTEQYKVLCHQVELVKRFRLVYISLRIYGLRSRNRSLNIWFQVDHRFLTKINGFGCKTDVEVEIWSAQKAFSGTTRACKSAAISMHSQNQAAFNGGHRVVVAYKAVEKRVSASLQGRPLQGRHVLYLDLHEWVLGLSRSPLYCSNQKAVRARRIYIYRRINAYF